MNSERGKEQYKKPTTICEELGRALTEELCLTERSRKKVTAQFFKDLKVRELFTMTKQLINQAEAFKFNNKKLAEEMSRSCTDKLRVAGVSPENPFCKRGDSLRIQIRLENTAFIDFEKGCELRLKGSIPTGLIMKPINISKVWKTKEERTFNLTVKTQHSANCKYELKFSLNSPFGCQIGATIDVMVHTVSPEEMACINAQSKALKVST